MTRTYSVGKNLTRKEAVRRGNKKVRGDFRGVKYNPKTGKIKYT